MDVKLEKIGRFALMRLEMDVKLVNTRKLDADFYARKSDVLHAYA